MEPVRYNRTRMQITRQALSVQTFIETEFQGQYFQISLLCQVFEGGLLPMDISFLNTQSSCCLSLLNSAYIGKNSRMRMKNYHLYSKALEVMRQLYTRIILQSKEQTHNTTSECIAFITLIIRVFPSIDSFIIFLNPRLAISMTVELFG